MRSKLRAIAMRTALMIPQVKHLHDARNALLAERNALAALTDELHLKLESSQSNTNTPKFTHGSPFYFYNSLLDLEEIIRRNAAFEVKPRPEYYVNFLDVAIDPKFLPEILKGKAGHIDEIPIPANWHADMAEWGAALRAVDLAGDRFTVIELGCGWGCWLNNAGAAARRAGKRVTLIGIEGDEGHLGFAVEACSANGFQPDQVHLHRGIAAATAGVALFPRQEVPGIGWGLQPIFGATEEQRAVATKAGTHDELRMITLKDVAQAHDRIDLLHIDIQGGEADLVDGSVDFLQEKVGYTVIGTHSRQIEGRIMKTMLDAGWILEVERPAIYIPWQGALHLSVDGVQGWRNPRFA